MRSKSSSQPAHTDHPLRHWDRTCPACVAEVTDYPEWKKGRETLQGYNKVTAPSEKPQPSATPRTEFVASWNDWDGAMCVTLDDYETLRRKLSAAQSDLARAVANHAADLSAQSAIAPHDRGELIDRVAKRLCQHAYPARTLDEYMAPKRELWMRLVPEATIAVDAILGAADNRKAQEGKDG